MVDASAVTCWIQSRTARRLCHASPNEERTASSKAYASVAVAGSVPSCT